MIDALRHGKLTIHGAMRLCKLPRAEQLNQFMRESEERAMDKIIRQAIAQPKKQNTTPDVVTVLEALNQQEARQPGSVVMRVGRYSKTVIVSVKIYLLGEILKRSWSCHEVPTPS